MTNFTTILRARNLLLALTCAGSIAISFQAFGNDCACDFAPPSVQAYGTNGSCGVFMYKRRTICEVSFAAAGASPRLAAEHDMAALSDLNEELSVALLRQHFSFRRTGQLGVYLDAKFVAQSLPTMVGSVVFRDSARAADIAIVDFYRTAEDFSEKMAVRMVEIFSGRSKPERGNWKDDMSYEIGRGYVSFLKDGGSGGQVRIVYFAE